jgi:hypothetical protein
MEAALEAIVDGLTSVLLVFEETQNDPTSHMVVASTKDIADVVDSLAKIAPSSVKSAAPEFMKAAEDLVVELHKTNDAIQSFSDRKLSKEEGAMFIGINLIMRNLILIVQIKHLLKTSVNVLKLQDDARVSIIYLAGRQVKNFYNFFS